MRSHSACLLGKKLVHEDLSETEYLRWNYGLNAEPIPAKNPHPGEIDCAEEE